MGKDKVRQSSQQTKIDQYMGSGSWGNQPVEGTGGLQEPHGSTGGIQILVGIEASGATGQAKIKAIVLHINLPRVDIRKVSEKSVSTEQHES
ncbi:hypothetical protein NDU88_004826 [Pleurodeles waltl]|uniref:Uncharacterized protein n=1 Tax=Pleurodeles waltl TaxID=8319 RepID=A0AAV7WWY4_PLEWA|nr:hypothetical protein NDU88_004826 [Pleurodeles waltl]